MFAIFCQQFLAGGKNELIDVAMQKIEKLEPKSYDSAKKLQQHIAQLVESAISVGCSNVVIFLNGTDAD